MPFDIVRSDITKMQVDAIVNPTDSSFSGSGGTDYAIGIILVQAIGFKQQATRYSVNQQQRLKVGRR